MDRFAHDISPEKLRSVISYDPSSGSMSWLPRSIDFFSYAKVPSRAAGRFNARFANKPALDLVHSNGYRYGEVFKRPLRAHRVAWAIFYGEWPEAFIDHVNGDRADNRIQNLRLATSSENNKNKAPWGSSPFLGVSLYKARGTYEANIKHEGKHIKIGYFSDENVAALAYNIFAHALHGEFARLNDVQAFPSDAEIYRIKAKAEKHGIAFELMQKRRAA